MSHRILVIEDDIAIMETLVIFLHYEGYQVSKARSVESALECLDEGRPDLVLLDYMLQDDTAEAVVEAARAQHPGVPIILLTAAEDSAGKGKMLGVDDVVSKPFELDVLLRIVRECIGSKTAVVNAASVIEMDVTTSSQRTLQ